VAPILYVTVDGILDPLGFSQVARVIEGLAGRGFSYVLLSQERQERLADSARVATIQARLDAAGIRWVRQAYATGGSLRAIGANMSRLAAAIVESVIRHGIGLIHARGYQAGLAALAAQALRRTPFLFDARGCWIDERLEEGRWFTRASILRAARICERQLYSRAAGVVTLTELHADDVRKGNYGAPPETVECITTCADFSEFRLYQDDEPRPRIDPEIFSKLRDRRVVALVGSINRSYRVTESIALAHRALKLRDDVHLLILSHQRSEYQRLLEQQSVPAERVTLADAHHDAMPQWLSLVDFGLLLLTEPAAKRGSMPTKLGEFLAAGVRPIAHGCNEEMGEWVRRAGSGHYLRDVGPASLDAAARWLAESPVERSIAERARETAAAHFSLNHGLDRYEKLLSRMVGVSR
jgi:glycosyltransferase involved in cell wall biosynthesis